MKSPRPKRSIVFCILRERRSQLPRERIAEQRENAQHPPGLDCGTSTDQPSRLGSRAGINGHKVIFLVARQRHSGEVRARSRCARKAGKAKPIAASDQRGDLDQLSTSRVPFLTSRPEQSVSAASAPVASLNRPRKRSRPALPSGSQAARASRNSKVKRPGFGWRARTKMLEM